MRKLNWPIWLGLLLSFFAFFSYPLIFVNWASTRDFPWANFILFAIADVLIVIGVRRAFAPGRRAKSLAPSWDPDVPATAGGGALAGHSDDCETCPGGITRRAQQ